MDQAREESEVEDSTSGFPTSSISGKSTNTFHWRVLLPVVGCSYVTSRPLSCLCKAMVGMALARLRLGKS